MKIAGNMERDVPAAVIANDENTGLPLIVCKHTAAPGEELTPERVAEILMDQDTEWHRAAAGR